MLKQQQQKKLNHYTFNITTLKSYSISSQPFLLALHYVREKISRSRL